jgi:DNA-binding transcriptional LysR family regulator
MRWRAISPRFEERWQLKPNILVESRAPHTLPALAEAGLGIAIVPSVIRVTPDCPVGGHHENE